MPIPPITPVSCVTILVFAITPTASITVPLIKVPSIIEVTVRTVVVILPINFTLLTKTVLVGTLENESLSQVILSPVYIVQADGIGYTQTCSAHSTIGSTGLQSSTNGLHSVVLNISVSPYNVLTLLVAKALT